jgi:hypothetical protein
LKDTISDFQNGTVHFCRCPRIQFQKLPLDWPSNNFENLDDSLIPITTYIANLCAHQNPKAGTIYREINVVLARELL